ncbi:MAG: glycoside hydrolase family 25 protein [Clostridiales Family XIII bacterium]|jgi:GH25 family lysozyme M1 (1,4-beta-N-acetylmuramidase)|nr:glycoside hydrolase family 25 protein [Clostridiales Family XIII bacterium]
MGQEDMRERKGRGNGLMLFLMILIIILLVAQAFFLVYQFLRDEGRAQGPDARPSREEAAPAEPTDEEIAARGWISADVLKRYAEEYNINTEFLSRIFRDKIIYKQAGKIIYADIDPNLKKHPYDWDALWWDERRPHYSFAETEAATAEGVAAEALFGIDVSRYQGNIDWARAAADGVEFAIIRMGYRGYDTGKQVVDEFFEANIQGARSAGVRVGVYFFSQAVNEAEAVEEAEMVLAGIAPYDVSFPVVFDIEEISGQNARTDALTAGEVTDIAIAFCERVREAGYTPMIYANPKWFVSRMELDRLEPYAKWLAQYYKTPTYPYAFAVWQFSSSGTVDGIKGNVDLDLAFEYFR